ncbi:MAG: ABC transporter substrate-binding protein [Chloroflexi bacterium]|nr:MAG: ABC transporter substrate-binding protein [Chloroflexota bacterium]
MIRKLRFGNRVGLLALLMTVVLLLGVALAPVSAQQTELTIGFSFADVDSLDPGVTTSSGVGIMIGHVFDTLIVQNPLGTFHPGLATEWRVNDDATEYTFVIRDDAVFHDGTPVNAEAVKFTFDRIVDPALNSQMAFSFLGSTNYAGTDVDGNTVTVRFNSPNAAFLDGVSQPQLGIVSPTAVEELGEDFGFAGIVGSGPFIFESFTPGSEVVLVRNPDYNWGSEEVFGRSGPSDLERITFKLIEEPNTRLAALESGEVDFIDGVPGLDVQRLDEDPNFVIQQFDQAGHGWSLMFNQEKAPSNELAVRRAVNYAIDKETMVDVVWNGFGQPACSPLTHVMFGYDPSTCDAFTYDPDMAAAILDEAGWVLNEETGIRERDGVPLVLEHYAPDRPLSAAMAEFVQADLAAVGIDFQINLVEFSAYLDIVRAGEHNTQNWWDTQTDPDGVMRTLFHSSNADGGTNRNRYRDEEMDRLIDTAAGIADPVERAAAYAQIQQKVNDEALMVFFEDPVVIYASVPNLEGLVVFSGGFQPNFYAAHFS